MNGVVLWSIEICAVRVGKTAWVALDPETHFSICIFLLVGLTWIVMTILTWPLEFCIHQPASSARLPDSITRLGQFPAWGGSHTLIDVYRVPLFG